MTTEEKKWLKIGGAVAGAVLLYKVFSAKTDTSGGAYDPTGNGNTGTSTPGYVFNASVVAEKLYDAMKTSGTDEMAIVKALTPVNEQQFALVREKFGKRSYNSLLGNQIRVNPFSSLPLVNLPGWLKSELSATRYNILRMKYPSHL